MVRILHTADWHLGHTAHDTYDATTGLSSRLLDMKRTIGWIGDIATDRECTHVVVAGDLTHRKFLTGYELELVLNFLARMDGAGIEVIIIGGNHDQYSHPGVASTVAALNGVNKHVHTFTTADTYELEDGRRLFMVPYPNRAALATSGLDAADVGNAISGWLAKEGAGKGDFLTAHLTVSGAKFNAKSQPLLMGASDMVVGWQSLLFDGCSGGLLGHIHAPQAPWEGLWYAGSPIAFTFGDTGKHGIAIQDGVMMKFIANPHDREFVTLTPGLTEHIPEGAFVRVMWEGDISAEDRAKVGNLVHDSGGTLEDVIETSTREVRAEVQALVDAESDEDSVRKWCESASLEEYVDDILAMMHAADEEVGA